MMVVIIVLAAFVVMALAELPGAGECGERHHGEGREDDDHHHYLPCGVGSPMASMASSMLSVRMNKSVSPGEMQP